MPIYVFNPAFDRVIQSGWIQDPFSGPFYDKLDEGPGWDAARVGHYPHSSGFDGNLFEVAFPDVTPTADALSFFGNVRVYGARIAIRSSLQEANSWITAKLAIFGSFGSGIPGVPVDNSIIQVPGTPSEQTIAGPGFLEGVETFHTNWSLRKNDGTDWTPADLNSAVAQIAASGLSYIYTVWLDVDMQLQPVTMAGNPHYPNQKLGMWQPISWRFNNAGNGVQKKYQVRVFTAAQYAAGGAGVNTWTKACSYDSGIVDSSKGFHDFTTKRGAKLIRGIADGTWTVAIHTAKDWKGGDWWSGDYVQTMVVGVPGTVTITAPTLNQVLTVSTPIFTCTSTVPSADIRGSLWRVYAEPVGGFPSDFDPDLTDQEVHWYGELDGPPANSIEIDLNGSLPNGNYRLYVRFQEVNFGDWTNWVYQPFSVNQTQQTAPALTVTPDATNGKVAYVLDWKPDDNLHDVQTISLTRQSVDNEDTLVRLATPDLDDGLLNDSIYIPGANFHNIYKANNTSLHVANLDVTAQVRPPDWASHATIALGSRWNVLSGNYRSWLFLLRSDNKLELRWSTDGASGTAVTQVSTVALPAFTNGDFRYLRAKLNVASNYTVTFQYSSDGSTWTTLGSVITGVGATSIFNSTSNQFLEIGSSNSGLADYGPIYVREWRLRTGIDASTNVVSIRAHDNLGALEDSMLINGTGTVHHFHIEGEDWEIPFNKSTVYVAQYKTRFETNNEYVWSNTTSSSPLTISKNQTWLVPVDSPALSRRVLTADGYHQYESTKIRSSSRALGRSLPIVQKAAGRGDEFSMGFTVIGETPNEDLLEILESDSKLLLKTPKRSWYVEISGPYSVKSRIYDARYGDEDTRVVEVPFVEVGAY